MDRSTWLGQMTVGAVEDLLSRAEAAGDMDLVAICEDALECDRAAQTECLRVLRESQVQS